ncbi:MAG TPA: hypothetical protein VGE83_05190 [Terracidiphilus sp.]|jgi:hypothetical protein
MADQDSRKFQEERIARIARELSPGCDVVFSSARDRIKFQLLDSPALGAALLAECTWERLPGELADKPDGWIKGRIVECSKGKIKG